VGRWSRLGSSKSDWYDGDDDDAGNEPGCDCEYEVLAYPFDAGSDEVEGDGNGSFHAGGSPAEEENPDPSELDDQLYEEDEPYDDEDEPASSPHDGESHDGVSHCAGSVDGCAERGSIGSGIGGIAGRLAIAGSSGSEDRTAG
jgi:hypothetical protein